ncbi:hypothetical protein ACFV6F_20710, partial [Kitasatospora phosalacinea]
MSTPIRGKRPARVAAVLFAAALASVVVVGPATADTVVSNSQSVTSTGSLGNYAAPGGTVTRGQVIARAEDWVANAVPYSPYGLSAPYGWWSDSATGGRYREDCSGFVSMAWQLGSSLNTDSLPSVATPISTSQLQPGDILNNQGDGHVILFGGWTGAVGTTFTYYAERSTGTTTTKATGDLTAGELAGHPTAHYQAYRYKNIVSGGSAAGRTSPVSLDGSGTHAAFVDAYGSVANDWVSNGAWQGPAGIGGQARSDSPVVLNADGGHAFFIDANGSVANDWVSNGAWQGPAGIGGQARAGSPIATNAAGTIVVFVDTNGNVVNDWADGSGWHGPAPVGGQARSDSPLAISANGDHVYFVDAYGSVANDWVSNGVWQGPAGTGGQARAGSGLATNASGSLVAFVDGNGNLANDWISNGAWAGPAGLGGQPRSDSPIALNANGDHVYFVDAYGSVANDWVSNGVWQGPAGTGG